jgi:hypothetical protein
MIIGRLIQATAFSGLAFFFSALTARAFTVTFNTNAAGTQFSSGGLTLTDSLGANATLTFTPDGDISVGTPSNINLGNFVLVCSACSTQAVGAGSFFNPFIFDMIITDVTDNAMGEFVGSSAGGAVWSDVSQITINWVPLQLGPGTVNAIAGSFGATTFTISTPTPVVAPNSGQVPGQSTVQAFLDTAVPEPVTLTMVGTALLGLGILRRKGLHRGKG